MAKNLKEKFQKRVIKKPNKLLAHIGIAVLKNMCRKKKVTFSYDYDPKQYKNTSCILLSTHPSRLDFINVLSGFDRKDVNIVVGYGNIMKKYVYTPLKHLGVICKYLYQPDITCTKNMLSVLKRNGSLVLFPEGIQSNTGSTHPINPATCKLLKKSKVHIFLAKSTGPYLCTNRYSKDVKKGPVHVHYSLLFTPEELATLTEDQIYNKLIEHFRYNEFEANRTDRRAYVGKLPNIAGLDNIIYICPHCHQEYTLSVENQTMTCSHCGYAVSMNEYYDLLPVNKELIFDDIDKWYKWQRKVVREQVRQEGFELTMRGKLTRLRDDKLKKAPNDVVTVAEGQITLNKDGLVVLRDDGTQEGFSIKGIYSLYFSKNLTLEFFYNEEFYKIYPQIEQKYLPKWTLASEELHNLVDEKWHSASSDVYDYE